MKTVPLGEVATITMGQAPPGHSYNDRGDGVPLIAGAGDFKDGHLSPGKYTTDGGKLCEAHDIVLSIRASIGAMVWADGIYCLGRGVAGIRAGSEVDRNFLWHWMSSTERELASKGKGATFLQVNRTDIAELTFPLFPLDEQRRIAAILDHADALRAKRRQVLAHLDALPQAIFHEMFGHMAAHREIGEFANVQTGATPPRDDPTNFNGGIPWIKTGEVTGIITATAETVSEQGAKKARLRRFPIGSVVIAMYGQGATRGRSALLAIEATTNQACAVIEPNESFEPVFLLTQLRIGYEQLRESAEGGNQPNLNLARIRSFKVRLPARETQRAFVQRVENVSRSMAVTAQALVADDELFASLQSQAFRGEL